jgi:hypothetical protein
MSATSRLPAALVDSKKNHMQHLVVSEVYLGVLGKRQK